MDHGGQNNDSRSQQTGGDVHGCDWHACNFAHSERVLALPTAGHTPAGPVRGERNHRRLDEVVTRHPSLTAWDSFAFP